MYVGWWVVVDKNCIKIVLFNFVVQKFIEKQYNVWLDIIVVKQQKVEFYLVSMVMMKEFYKLLMQNIFGFGMESLYYKEIGSCVFDIIWNVLELIKMVSKVKFINQFYCLMEFGGLVMEIQQLVGNFVNIVNNVKIFNLFKGEGIVERKSDGYNIFDCYEWMLLVNFIYINLNEICYKVDGMMFMVQYVMLNDFCFVINFEGWVNVMIMCNQVDGFVLDWNGLVVIN